MLLLLRDFPHPSVKSTQTEREQNSLPECATDVKSILQRPKSLCLVGHDSFVLRNSRGGAKNTTECERAKGARKFLGLYSRKFSGFSTE